MIPLARNLKRHDTPAPQTTYRLAELEIWSTFQAAQMHRETSPFDS
jgi:hypothetical protein